MSIPVRQPRGPSIHSFAAVSQGPPEPDADALRRSNTVSNPRQHQPSASVSSLNPFPGSRYRNASRFRSGSLSSTNNAGVAPVRTTHEVPAEEVLVEEGEPEWKGLSRQSSLPSRRCRSPGCSPSDNSQQCERFNERTDATSTSTTSERVQSALSRTCPLALAFIPGNVQSSTHGVQPGRFAKCKCLSDSKSASTGQKCSWP
jgi:hypothetical protein